MTSNSQASQDLTFNSSAFQNLTLGRQIVSIQEISSIFSHFPLSVMFSPLPTHLNGPKYPWPNRTQRSISFSVFVATRLVSETDAWPPVRRPSARRGAPSAGEEPSAHLPPFLLPSWTTLRLQTGSAAAKIQRRHPPVSTLAIGLVLLVAMAIILVVTRRELEHETDGLNESNMVGGAPTARSTAGGSPMAPPPPSSIYGWCTGGRASTSSASR